MKGVNAQTEGVALKMTQLLSKLDKHQEKEKPFYACCPLLASPLLSQSKDSLTEHVTSPAHLMRVCQLNVQ